MKTLLQILGIIVVLGVVYGPSLAGHMENARSQYMLNDDARPQIPPFYHFEKDSKSEPDYMDQYYLDIAYPMIYKNMMMRWANLYSPVILSKALPYINLLIIIVALAFVSWRFGGWATALATGALYLGCDLILDRMTGGLPRGFGYPFLAVALALLVYERIYLLCAATIISAGFYPVASVVSGIMLGAYLFILKAKYRPKTTGWGFVRRGTVLAVTGALTISMLLPQLIAGKEYGERIGPEHLEEYPEAGLGGRVEYRDMVSNNPFQSLYEYGASSFATRGEPFVNSINIRNLSSKVKQEILSIAFFVIILIIVIGFRDLARIQRNPEAMRYSVFLLAIVIAYILAAILSPLLYFPERYLMYTLPIVYITALPIASYAVFGAGKEGVRKIVATLSVPLLVILLIGGKVNADSGYTVQIEDNHELYEFIKTLPEDSIIAGWPSDPVVNNVTYLTKRPVFLSFELHQVLHEKYVKQMRKRAYANIDAYLATNLEELQNFRDKFDVNYLVINKNHFNNTLPKYFAPFDKYIQKKWKAAEGQKKGFILPKLGDDDAVYTGENIVIINLAKWIR